jgi:hypothetical protein
VRSKRNSTLIKDDDASVKRSFIDPLAVAESAVATSESRSLAEHGAFTTPDLLRPAVNTSVSTVTTSVTAVTQHIGPQLEHIDPYDVRSPTSRGCSVCGRRIN